MEEAFVAKAYTLMLLVNGCNFKGRFKIAKAEIYKVLEINPNNKQALDLLSKVNERINSGTDMTYGKVEISLKKKQSSYSTENLLLE